MSRSCLLTTCLLLCGCSHVHQIQLGEIDTRGPVARPFVIELESAAIDAEAVASVSYVPVFSDFLKYTSMGPKTGQPTYFPRFIDNVKQQLQAECEGGHVTGLMTRRSSKVFPFVSVETVRLQGYCVEEGAQEEEN